MIADSSQNLPRELAWDGGQQRQGRYQGVVRAVEWAALLLGLLPCGVCGGRRSRLKTAVAFAAAGIAFVLNIVFISVYFKKNLRELPGESENNLMSVILPACYSVITLGPLAILLILWLKSSLLTQVLVALKTELSTDKTRVQCSLHSILLFLYCFVDYFVCLWYRYVWNEDVLLMPHGNFLYTASVWYSFLSQSLIYTFPLVLFVTAGHVIYASLSYTNEELQQRLLLRRDPMKPQVNPRYQELRGARTRYLHLRLLHQHLSDVLAIPIMIWTLEKILCLVFMVFYIASYQSIGHAECCIFTPILAVEYFMSMYVFCSHADHITVQAARPQDIILDADAATEPENPEFEAEVVRLLKMCERPLVIRPCGLYVVSCSNLLTIASTVTTYMVVLLQFYMGGATHTETAPLV